MRTWLTGRIAPAALAAVVVLAAGGGGYALASGGSTVTLCVKKHGGMVYKAKKCHKGSSKLTLGKTGPAGAKGATGATGPAGAPGAAGSGAGYATSTGNSNATKIGSTLFPAIDSLTLPAGKYIVNAAVTLNDTADASDEATCYVEVDNNTFAGDDTRTTPNSSRQDVAITGAVNLPSSNTVTLNCADFGTGNMTATISQLTALQVGTLTGSTST